MTLLALQEFTDDMRCIARSRWTLLFSKTSRVSLAIRVRTRSGSLVSFLAKLYLYRHLVEVGRRVKIGPGLNMPHPKNIIIADTAIIGADVQINQGVTIGGNFKRERFIEGELRKIAIMGNHVTVLPNAVIGGPVLISSNVVIGANSVVTKDVPAHCIVTGVNQVRKLSEKGSVREYLRSKSTSYCVADVAES